MGQHHREGIKGDGYKVLQRVNCPPRRIKPARITERWMDRHGWIKGEDGKWRRKP
jgi:hypothetical protein